MEPSLQDLVSKIAPIVTYYTSIENFIAIYSRFDCGKVNHALCAAIRELLKEYTMLVVQLEQKFRETPEFTLHKLWYHISPTLETMRSLHKLIMAIHNEVRRNSRGVTSYPKGHVILDVMVKLYVDWGGDQSTKYLFAHLLSKASAPYFQMLLSWIHQGELRDPYGEFMVKVRSMKNFEWKYDVNDTLWERQYLFRDGRIPSFLEPYKDKILLAGKYLNIMKRYGTLKARTKTTSGEDISPEIRLNAQEGQVIDVLQALEGGRYIKEIDDAYIYSNRLLLDLLMKEKQAFIRLRSMKRYFFLDQSDFFNHFLDLAWPELRKPYLEASFSKLQLFLDLALRNPDSPVSADPFREELRVTKSGHSLVSRFESPNISGKNTRDIESDLQRNLVNLTSDANKSAMDMLNLDINIEFPFSLVISPRAVAKYQQIFRHLAKLKGVEKQLTNVWSLSRQIQHSNKQKDKESLKFTMQIQVQCHRMLQFVQQIIYFVSSEVLEPNWSKLERQLIKVNTVDQVLQCHTDFLDSCLHECMIDSSNESRRQVLYMILDVCSRFTSFAERILKRGSSQSHSEPIDQYQIPQDNRHLATSDRLFLVNLREYIETLEYRDSAASKRQSLAVRLDYNLWYSIS
ncbi:gamma tubulin complex Spc97/GCP2 subunit Alp4, variant 3 [Basidiobolus ranarum]